MAQTVRELEESGYVARRPDPDDGRRFFIELTDAGLARLQEDRRRRDGWLAQALREELSASERTTLAAAAPLLRRLSAA
jgi:DNA-binding MarR family transcriptional regulator